MSAEAPTPEAERDNGARVIAIKSNLAEREEPVRESLSDRIVYRFAITNCISRVMLTHLISLSIRIHKMDMGPESKLRNVAWFKTMYLARCAPQFEALSALGLRTRLIRFSMESQLQPELTPA